MRTDLLGMRLQIVLVHDLEHRRSHCAGNCAAAEGAEELEAIAEGCRDLGSGHHGSNGIAIADGLAQHHDVRDNILQLETVEMHSEPAVRGLHLISNTHAACLANPGVHRRQIPIRKDELSSDTGTALGDVATETFALRLQLRDAVAHGVRILLARARNAGFERAAVYIGESDHVHPRRPGRCARSVSLIRTDVSEGGRVAVIGGIEHDEISGSRMGTRNAQGKLVRLTPGVHEVAYPVSYTHL